MTSSSSSNQPSKVPGGRVTLITLAFYWMVRWL